MPEQSASIEPFDLYSDQFTITITPYGANLSFGVNAAHPVATNPQPAKHLGTVRMSNEHLKVLVFLCRRQVMEVERGSEVKADVSRIVLNGLQIAPEDWEQFWA